MINEKDYKLVLRLSLLSGKPDELCFMCDTEIDGVYYVLTEIEPIEALFYYEKNCFDQVVAVGFQFLRDFLAGDSSENSPELSN